jgi:hypothetical protein
VRPLVVVFPKQSSACKRPQDAIQRLSIDTSGLRQVCYRLWTRRKKIRNAQLRCHHDQIGELRIIEQAPQVFRRLQRRRVHHHVLPAAELLR